MLKVEVHQLLGEHDVQATLEGVDSSDHRGVEFLQHARLRLHVLGDVLHQSAVGLQELGDYLANLRSSRSSHQ